jgi:hypothetical protein
MTSGSTQLDLTQRIKPILDNVAIEGLRAWLRGIGFSVPRLSRAGITEFVTTLIAKRELAEDALEVALVGFEEASDMRIYLLQLDDDAAGAKRSLAARLRTFGFPIEDTRRFAGNRTRPMSPVYAQVEGNGNLLRLKWAEQQRSVTVNANGTGVDEELVQKRAVLIVDYHAKSAELRLNPPENGHTYEDPSGRTTAEAYYSAYLKKARDIVGCEIVQVELRPVIKRLVEQQDPRIIRIHIDNHTNQKNYKTKTIGPNADVRDDPDWQLAYRKNGETWAWDAQSFYWLPKASSEFLTREVFSHIDAGDGFVKVNADCSNDEVEYVVSQIRAR